MRPLWPVDPDPKTKSESLSEHPAPAGDAVTPDGTQNQKSWTRSEGGGARGGTANQLPSFMFL